jgi:hypothetical protein
MATLVRPRALLLAPLLSLLFISPAHAGDPSAVDEAGRQHLATPSGTSVQVGGGVANFPEEKAGGNTGGYWELRGVFGTRRSLGAELAYVGGARRLVLPAAGGMLLSHGGEALVRVNALIESAGRLLLEPFSFMGLGWTRFSTSGLEGRAGHHVLTVPVGVGFAFGRDGYLIDLRLSYRPVLAGGSRLTLAEGEAPLQSWTLGTLAGFEF